VPGELLFALSAGRTGTAYLARLLQANLPQAEVHHERLGPEGFGLDSPELSQLQRFNHFGSDEWVQAFWTRKFARIAASPAPLYAETSHLLMKAGLCEHLALAGAPVQLLCLRRDPLATTLSLLGRHPLLERASLWLWYLDPRYPRNRVPAEPYLSQPRWGYWLWYLLEVEARMQHYEAQCARAGVRVHRVQLERIVGEDGAGELLAALGHRVERVSLPGRTNEGRPLAKVPEDLRAEIAARVATLAEEARAYA
jgi:hypothetical protein